MHRKYFVLPGSKGADGIQVVSYRPDQRKVVQEKLEKFWVPDSRIRINNKSDRNMAHHSEEEIRQQVTYVRSLCCLILEDKSSYTILRAKCCEYRLLHANDGPMLSTIYD
jgi:hypothetical protein